MKIVRRHALSLTLATAWLAMTLYTLWTGMGEYRAEHGGLSDFWRWWTYEWVMSNLADVFGALALVVLIRDFGLRERGGAP